MILRVEGFGLSLQPKVRLLWGTGMPSYYSVLGLGPEKPEWSEARTFWDGDHRPGCFPAEFHVCYMFGFRWPYSEER